MVLLLNSDNILSYLSDSALIRNSAPGEGGAIQPKPGKNFNLRVTCKDGDWLVKQESHGLSNRAAGELEREYQFFHLLKGSALEEVRSQVIAPIHFDKQNAIIVFPYLPHAQSLSDSFRSNRAAPLLAPSTAASLGRFFATLHSRTFHNQNCKALSQHFSQKGFRHRHTTSPNFLRGLRQLTPESFCVIPTDALKFFRFYQRHPEIGEAIAQLEREFERCCIVHNDPRFANFLQHENGKIIPIDWEKWEWGDPAYDLARLIANYLKLWLRSLPVSADLDLGTILSRAGLPLSAIQPSVAQLMQSYLTHFPCVLQRRPDFVVQVVQFVGLALIRQVQLTIAQKHPCGNIEMAMAQVAKTLLCQPESAISTVFGCERTTLEAANMQAIGKRELPREAQKR